MREISDDERKIIENAVRSVAFQAAADVKVEQYTVDAMIAMANYEVDVLKETIRICNSAIDRIVEGKVSLSEEKQVDILAYLLRNKNYAEEKLRENRLELLEKYAGDSRFSELLGKIENIDTKSS